MIREIIYLLLIFFPSWFKIPILRLCGARIGKHVSIGIFSYVSAGRIEISNFAVIRAFTLIHCNETLKIGEYSEISGFVMIYGESGLYMGKNCYIGPRVFINVTKDVRMDNLSAIGPCSVLFTHGAWLPYTEGYPRKFKEIIVEEYVWISGSVRIVPGVRIGRNSFINTGSVVTRDIQENSFVEGAPAKEICSMDKIKRVITPDKLGILIEEMVEDFTKEILQKKLKLGIKKNNFNYIFRFKGRSYMFILPEAGGVSQLPAQEGKIKTVIVFTDHKTVSQKDYGKNREVLIFDFTKMATDYSQDIIHRELWRFFRRFYGVKFDYVNF